MAVTPEADRQLGGGGRLARSLQTDEQHHGGRRRAEIKRVPLPAQDLDQLVVDELHDLGAGIHAVQDGGSDRSLADPGNEQLDHTKVDVGLEQGHPDVAQRGIEVCLGEAGLAPQARGDVLETGRKGVKHRSVTAHGASNQSM